MRTFKKITLGILILVGLLQLIPKKVNKSNQLLATDITYMYVIPADVQSILSNSCYDCHSNNTRYPWYALIQPIRLMLDNHVDEGKRQLNFSEFGSYTKKRQRSKLNAIEESIQHGSMPISSYALMHADASLSNAEKEKVYSWIAHSKNVK